MSPTMALSSSISSQTNEMRGRAAAIRSNASRNSLHVSHQSAQSDTTTRRIGSANAARTASCVESAVVRTVTWAKLVGAIRSGRRAHACGYVAQHCASADDAPFRERIVGCRTMQHAAIVPDDQLARSPPMLVGEIGMNRERVQRLDQRPPLVVRHPD